MLRSVRRDPVAFASLIRSHERSALALAFAILGDAPSAGDAVQESFIKAWQRLPELKEPDRFVPWFAQIVRNTALDARRRRPAAAEELDTLSLGFHHNPTAALEESETRDRIDTALRQLDEITRSAVVLRYYDNLSSRAIGAILEISPAAVDTRLSRARDELRQKLAPEFNQREIP
ncbi:MAG TPA: sigma-70 family RNA polymerase sigma factor [Tepidisphaeraceae bacterium]|nr:sigma-70 family RNA polymerase sigma factor [Tepidisphaeraceae bacterium]